MSRTRQFGRSRACVAAAALATCVVTAGLAPTASAVIPGTSLNPTTWLRADALGGLDANGNPNPLPASGSPVNSWLNTSNAQHNATQGAASQQPTFRASVVNGLPVVRFDGSSAAGQGDYMSISDGAWANTGASFLTLFVVAKDNRAPTDTNNKTVLSTRDTSSRGWITSYEPNAVSQKYVHIGSVGAVNQVSESLGANAFHVLELRRTGLSVEVSHDGGAAATANISGFSPTSLNVTYIGHNDGNTARFFNGDVAEIVAFDGTALSNGDKELVERYLMQKYAIGGAAVPEPTGLAVLGGVAVTPLLGRRRRRGR